MEERLPLLDLTYRISMEDYQAFNFLWAKSEIARRKRRSTILGGLEIVVGGMMLISLLTGQVPGQPLYYILDSLLILMGAYSLTYYYLLFPKQLERSARRNYEKNPYLQNDIHLTFFEDGIQEDSFEVDTFVDYEEVGEIRRTPKLLLFVFKTNKCAIVPRSHLEERGLTQRMDELIGIISEQHTIKVS